MLEKEIATLGLAWPVEFVPAPQEITARCLSQRGQHQILIDRYTMADLDGRGHHLLHELCHCRMAETIDLSMSQMQFLHSATAEELQRSYLVWAPIDLWVNRLRHEHWTAAIVAEQNTLRKELAMIGKNSGIVAGNPSLSILIALYRVEGEHYKLAQDTRILMRALYPNDQRRIKALEAIMRKMLAMEASVPNLQGAMREFARVWGFDFLTAVRLEWADHFQMHCVSWR